MRLVSNVRERRQRFVDFIGRIGVTYLSGDPAGGVEILNAGRRQFNVTGASILQRKRVWCKNGVVQMSHINVTVTQERHGG